MPISRAGKTFRVIFGCGDMAYITDVTATDSVRALCAAAAYLTKVDGVPLVTIWNHVYFGNVKVKPVKVRVTGCEP